MCDSNRSSRKNGNLEQSKILGFLIRDSRHLSLERILVLEPGYSVSITHSQLHTIIFISVVQCQLWLEIRYLMRRTLSSGGCGVVSPGVGFSPIVTAGPQWTQTPTNVQHWFCKSISLWNPLLFCVWGLKNSLHQKNNLPDVLISPVRLWFYIRRIF